MERLVGGKDGGWGSARGTFMIYHLVISYSAHLLLAGHKRIAPFQSVRYNDNVI